MDALTAMKQALVACRAVVYDYPTSHVTLCDEAMTALTAAIEKMEKWNPDAKDLRIADLKAEVMRLRSRLKLSLDNQTA